MAGLVAPGVDPGAVHVLPLEACEIVAAKAAVMKTAGDKRAGNSFALERKEIGAVADAASGIDLSSLRDVANCAQPIKIGPGAAADPPQRHDDQPLGPGLNLGEQRRRP